MGTNSKTEVRYVGAIPWLTQYLQDPDLKVHMFPVCMPTHTTLNCDFKSYPGLIRRLMLLMRLKPRVTHLIACRRLVASLEY